MGDRLKDRVAIVVGAGSSGPGWGNGKATAVTFAREGAKVWCVDLNAKAAQETVDIIKGEGGEARPHVANVSVAAEVQRMVEACLSAYGRIDVLHNNVGIARMGGPVELSEEDWDLVLDVNLKSFFLTCKYVLPVMEKQRRGSIINVSSVAGIRTPKGIAYVAYNASKGGVNSLTQAVASQYADKGIRCNAILPGLMHTPMIAPLSSSYSQGDYEKMIEIRNKACPTGKMGTAWDVANAALFLAGDESSYVSGHLMVVDGALTVRA
jgi:NAD(P)-dependent dehydrogenase (short-subunit alcohol dehydrogenase family)